MKEHMQEQTFIVTLRASPGFYRYFPRIDAKGLALTIKDSIRAKSRRFFLPMRFEIKVKWRNELASASGEIGCYVPELDQQLDEIPIELAMNPEY